MKGVALVCGLGFLYFAFASIRNGAVPFKSGYRLERSRDPFGYWGAVGSLAAIGALALYLGWADIRSLRVTWAMPESPPIWAYFLVTAVAMLAPLGLCLYTAAWFARRARVRPEPSATPGIFALVVAVSAMALVGLGIAFCNECVRLPWAPLLVQGALISLVIVAWIILGRVEKRWPSA